MGPGSADQSSILTGLPVATIMAPSGVSSSGQRAPFGIVDRSWCVTAIWVHIRLAAS